MPTFTPPCQWQRRHILSLQDFTVAELDIVLQTARSFQEVL
ncbi:MAG TPA: aspartate carbamoyltransferase, partial [Thermosynechococcus sp. M46_R2017_013]|nr:aspartate carbamoyltransferase [Thermosynechococcus sp. M46_R2017_013]